MALTDRGGLDRDNVVQPVYGSEYRHVDVTQPEIYSCVMCRSDMSLLTRHWIREPQCDLVADKGDSVLEWHWRHLIQSCG